ncbi:MAG: pyridoxal-phosphate dependent enzyme [Pseudonocardiales bacterium]|jgi:threonine dehydratase|nr:pyridoxal-phosphate dependent enzyme [Pseudonocardiales bacterium]
MPPGVPTLALSAERIERAAHDVPAAFRATPQFGSPGLSSSLGFDALLKVETVNPIRSFKGRGTDFLAQHSDAEVLVCASAGNLGQGLAFAGRTRGRRVIIYASRHISELKASAMRALDAEVRLVDGDFDAAKDAADDAAREHGWQLVVDGREPSLAEGAGGMAVELTDAGRPLDAVLVPVGNGSLACGVAHWFKAVSPQTRVIAVGSVGAPAMYAAWRSGDLLTGAPTTTIAEGLAARVPVPEAVGSMRTSVDDFVLVDDDALREAMRVLLAHTGLVSEPSGAAALAGAMLLRAELVGGTVALPLTGANIDPETLSRLLAT